MRSTAAAVCAVVEVIFIRIECFVWEEKIFLKVSLGRRESGIVFFEPKRKYQQSILYVWLIPSFFLSLSHSVISFWGISVHFPCTLFSGGVHRSPFFLTTFSCSCAIYLETYSYPPHNQPNQTKLPAKLHKYISTFTSLIFAIEP